MKSNWGIIMLLQLTLPGIVSAAEAAYQWTDQQGQTHYGDKRPASIEPKTIILQQVPIKSGSHSGLRPGERAQLDKMEQQQRQQQRSANAAGLRTDHQRAARRARCEDNREMLKNSRGRDSFKKYSRYLRNNCW